MKGYKAFEKGLICRGKQYAENTVFEEGKAEICKSGMHFCKDPLEVLEYYPLVDNNGNINEFAEVEALDDAHTDDNKKYCTKRLKIGAKISFAKLVQASVKFDYEKVIEDTKVKTTSKKNAKIGSSGDYAKIGSSGYSAQIGSSGNSAKINSTGKNAVIMCAGDNSKAKAKIGSWITLAEWKTINNVYTPVCVKTEQVDGERIKEDTYYQLKNGEFVEV